MGRGSPTLLLGLGFLGFELVYLCLARLGDLRQHAGQFLVGFGIASVIFLILVWALRQWRASQAHPSRRMIAGIVLGGVIFRATLAGLTPTLSDDIYRYLWDGRVQQAGINPYRYAPDDETLAGLRTEEWRLINHKDIPTIYPPLAQAAFRIGVAVSQTVLAQKLLFLACDLAIILLLTAWLPRWGVSPVMSLIYAWHPLAVIEVAGSGHNDPLGVLWMLLGLALWTARRRVAGTLAFALAFLSKLTTALLWPFYWVRARGLLGWWLLAIGLAGLWCWCSPYFAPGFHPYASSWEFNSSAYAVLRLMLGHPLAARLVCGLLVIVAGFLLARRTEDLLGYTLAMIQTAILVAPVVEPWYLLWLIPLLCVRFSWIWLAFSLLVMLSYTVLIRYVADGVWKIPAWALWVEYGPLYGWLLARAVKRVKPI